MRESTVAGQSLKHLHALLEQKLSVVHGLAGREGLQSVEESPCILAFEVREIVEDGGLFGLCILVLDRLDLFIRSQRRFALDGADDL